MSAHKQNAIIIWVSVRFCAGYFVHPPGFVWLNSNFNKRCGSSMPSFPHVLQKRKYKKPTFESRFFVFTCSKSYILRSRRALNPRSGFPFSGIYHEGYLAVSVEITFKTNLLSLTEQEKYVRLCVSLSLWILWRQPKAMYLRASDGDQISKTNLWTTA